ncbi:MAG: hypothetical protein SH809_04360 [Rhodothermales bacterium]|nr:hypothetical protein [Rhodothermales bacterium]
MRHTLPIPIGLLLGALLLTAAPALGQEALIPPLPPRTFAVDGLDDGIVLGWTTHPGQPDPDAWEVYRTVHFADNLPYTLLHTLPGSARAVTDTAYVMNTGYYYYLVAVGGPMPVDPTGLHGTPDGRPLRSARYAAQTDILTAVGFRPGLDSDDLIVSGPNPFSSEIQLRYIANGPALIRLSVFNTLGQEVAVLVDDFIGLFASREVRWAGVDHSGRRLPSGIYFAQLAVGARPPQSVSMALVR